MKKCKDCIYFLNTTNFNNCKGGTFYRVDPEDSGCYKIAEKTKKENNNLLY